MQETEDGVGLRERQKRARRESLIDAAHRLAARDGLDHVTVEMICAEAGVSPRTFFNYFESKDDAVLGHEPWSIDPVTAEKFASGGPTGSVVTDLQVLVGSLLDSPMMSTERLAVAHELARTEPRLLVKHMAWMEQHKNAVVSLIARRYDSTEDDPRVEVAGMVLMVLTRATIRRWEASGRRGIPHEHLPDAVADLRHLVDDR